MTEQSQRLEARSNPFGIGQLEEPSNRLAKVLCSGSKHLLFDPKQLNWVH